METAFRHLRARRRQSTGSTIYFRHNRVDLSGLWSTRQGRGNRQFAELTRPGLRHYHHRIRRATPRLFCCVLCCNDREDRNWQDALPGLAWHPGIIGLRPGQVSRAWDFGATTVHFYVAATRLDEESPWLTAPLALQTAAFESAKAQFFFDEVERVQSRDLLRIKLGE